MAKMLKFVDNEMIEYEILPLVDYYDSILRKPTVLWDFKNKTFTQAQSLIHTLAESLQKYGGLGLSANQLGLPYRVCAVNMGNQIWTMFNPEIIDRSEDLANFSEGCLSYPGLYLKVNRSNSITVEFQALNGGVVRKDFDGLTAVCVQHELDHLDGVLYSQRVSPIKLEQAKKKVKKNIKKLREMTGAA